MPKAHGFTLMEIMISLALMSLIMFMMSSAHLSALKADKYNYYYTLAEQQGKMLSECLLHSNPESTAAEKQRFKQYIHELLPNGAITDMDSSAFMISWGSAKPQSKITFRWGNLG